MRRLTVDQAQYTAYQLVKELLVYDEPMPAFTTRFPGRLEACLDQPFSTFDSKYLYRTLTKRSAVLFYGVIKNHPFENGNKRMAVVLLLLFLFINKKWLDIQPDELYDTALQVAKSRPADRDNIIKALDKTIRQNLTDRI